MKGNGLYQGTRWQYRWAVPIYADKMIEWVGREQLADELSEFFRLQLFNQGNEPDMTHSLAPESRIFAATPFALSFKSVKQSS